MTWKVNKHHGQQVVKYLSDYGKS